MLRPGNSKQARFENRCSSWVLFRRRRFYSKRLLLGAFGIASEAARQLTSFCGYILSGAYERRIAARWSVLLVNLRFVKLANAGFLIWQHTSYYVVVG